MGSTTPRSSCSSLILRNNSLGGGVLGSLISYLNDLKQISSVCVDIVQQYWCNSLYMAGEEGLNAHLQMDLSDIRFYACHRALSIRITHFSIVFWGVVATSQN